MGSEDSWAASAVTIVCNARSHAGREAVLDRFEFGPEGTSDHRVLAVGWKNVGGDPETYTDAWQGRSSDRDARIVRGERRPVLPVGSAASDDPHVRHKFTCKLCGDSLTARGERLYPVLSILRDAAIASISIESLRARLR